MKKFVSEEELENELSTSDKSTVFASGVFDLFHEGHKFYLSESKKQGDILVVFVHSDLSTKRMKGNARPIQSENLRLKNVASFEFVDYVVLFDEEVPYRVLQKFKPSVMARSGIPKDIKVKSFVEELGCKAFYSEVLPEISTTRILEKWQKITIKH